MQYGIGTWEAGGRLWHTVIMEPPWHARGSVLRASERTVMGGDDGPCTFPIPRARSSFLRDTPPLAPRPANISQTYTHRFHAIRMRGERTGGLRAKHVSCWCCCRTGAQVLLRHCGVRLHRHGAAPVQRVRRPGVRALGLQVRHPLRARRAELRGPPGAEKSDCALYQQRLQQRL